MEIQELIMRKSYLDNIRWGIIILVVIYHIIYIFNSVGVISNIGVKGIPQMDVMLYFIYPWFMACLFLVGGISARYSLQKRTGKQFAKERVKRLLVPSIAGIFILGWISGYVTNHYVDMFGGKGNLIPGFIKYLIYSLCGIGPLWFAHELFLASMILLLFRKFDKNDTLWKICKKTNMIIILLLFFAVWGSSFILNTPLITVYRNGIYIFMFLLGYYVFSHDEVQERLKKWHLPLLISAVICGITYTIYYYGDNYTTATCLQSLFTNFYLWIIILAILGCGKAWFNGTNHFTEYMNKRTFGIYVLHYPVLTISAYLLTTYLQLPMLLYYFILLIIEIMTMPLLYEIISRIPVLSFLLLGISKHSS
ncbi:acyltransferase family protein [Clostridium kluyveri]|nr:acyltransferase [Clostridium kluyveri]